MTKQEAVEILKNHNKWIKGEDVQPYSPSVLSEAIDTVTEAIVPNQSHTADVTDEEISEAAKLCIKDTEGDIIVDDMIDKVFYFNSGAKWALSRMPDDGWVKVESYNDVLLKLTAAVERMNRARGILNRRDGLSNWGMLDTSDLLPKSPTT